MQEPEPPVYEEEEANWDDAQDVEYEEIPVEPRVEEKRLEYAVPDEDTNSDPWEDDDNPKPYRSPQVNIPERKRVVEYEEETDY